MQKRCDLLMDISVIITVIIIIVVVNIIIIVANINIMLKSILRKLIRLSPFFPGSTHPIRPGRRAFANILSAPIPTVISFRLTGRQ